MISEVPSVQCDQCPSDLLQQGLKDPQHPWRPRTAPAEFVGGGCCILKSGRSSPETCDKLDVWCGDAPPNQDNGRKKCNKKLWGSDNQANVVSFYCAQAGGSDRKARTGSKQRRFSCSV